MKNLISIIIPVYRGNPVYFNKTIESCLNQTYQNVEVIIIDNGCNDVLQDTLSELNNKDNVTVVKNSKSGVCSGRNLGVKTAKGDYIMFLDADDWIESNACEILLNHAVEAEADCVICNYSRDYSDHSEKMLHYIRDTMYKDWKDYLKDLLNVQAGVGFCWGKLIKASTIENVLLNEELSLAEDAEYCARASQNWSVIVGDEHPLVHYIFNDQSAIDVLARTSSILSSAFFASSAIYGPPCICVFLLEYHHRYYLSTKIVLHAVHEALSRDYCLLCLIISTSLPAVADKSVSSWATPAMAAVCWLTILEVASPLVTVSLTDSPIWLVNS